MRQTLYQSASEFGHYRVVDTVYDGRLARVLYGSNDTPQSGMAVDDDPELLFNYNQRFLEVAQSLCPASVLVIGGGTMTFPTALTDQLPGVKIDIVEIDDLLPQLAADYFGFMPSADVKVTIGDGVDYMNSCAKQYDLIVIDAFDGDEVARPLLNADIAQRYRDCLTHDGIVVVNFIAKYRTRRQSLTHEMVTAFESAFADVNIYPADYDEPRRNEQNLILVGATTSPRLDYLQSASVDVLPANQ